MIRKDCFWYRPWKDMSATIDQCEFEDTGLCSCTEKCNMYIERKRVDELVKDYVFNVLLWEQ